MDTINIDNFFIGLNGRFLHEKIYDQDYPIFRKSKINFNGEDIVQHPNNNNVIKYYSKYNSNGFRCDNFTNNHDGSHILFAGCSETVGEGSIIDDSWSHMLYNKILKSSRCSGFFSLGIGGGSWIDICSLIMQYIDKYECPDYIFINFPNLGRYLQYIDKNDYNVEQNGVYRYALHHKDIVDHIKHIKAIGTTNFNLIEQDYIYFSLYIRLFENFCKEKNIRLFWGTWSEDLVEQIDRGFVNYKNFIKIHPNNNQLAELCLSNKNLSLEKPDGHFGTAYHTHWSNVFYDKYKGEIHVK